MIPSVHGMLPFKNFILFICVLNYFSIPFSNLGFLLFKEKRELINFKSTNKILYIVYSLKYTHKMAKLRKLSEALP